MVVIDEMGSNLNLTPRYARAPRGERAHGSIPRNTPPNTTLIAALTLDGMGAAMVLEGATTTAAFEVYVEHFLAPTLRRGQVVVLDNLSAHKSTHVAEMITKCGCELWPLPAYSPDFSPIEEAFSKVKNGLRRAKARTAEALLDALADGFGHNHSGRCTWLLHTLWLPYAFSSRSMIMTTAVALFCQMGTSA